MRLAAMREGLGIGWVHWERAKVGVTGKGAACHRPRRGAHWLPLNVVSQGTVQGHPVGGSPASVLGELRRGIGRLMTLD